MRFTGVCKSSASGTVLCRFWELAALAGTWDNMDGCQFSLFLFWKTKPADRCQRFTVNNAAPQHRPVMKHLLRSSICQLRVPSRPPSSYKNICVYLCLFSLFVSYRLTGQVSFSGTECCDITRKWAPNFLHLCRRSNTQSLAFINPYALALGFCSYGGNGHLLTKMDHICSSFFFIRLADAGSAVEMLLIRDGHLQWRWHWFELEI